MAGIGVILNPHSRSNRKNPGRARQLGFIVGDKGSCHATQSLADVERLAHEFRERQIDVLGISGGDGTLHATLSTFIKVYGETPLPMIAFLRGGTMNNVAGTIGIHGEPETILSNIIVKYHQGEAFRTTNINLLNVNGWYGFVFGVGVVVRYLEAYTARGEEYQTPWRAFTTLMGIVGSALVNGPRSQHICERFDARIIADGKQLSFKNYNFVFGGTIESLTLGFRPLWRARRLEDKFQFVAMSSTPRHIIANFPYALMGRTSKSPCILDIDCRELIIELDQPMRYSIDGDFPEGPVKRIVLSLGPQLTCIIE